MNMEEFHNFTKIENLANFALFASRAVNVALVQGKVGVLGALFAKRWKMTKLLDFYQISPNFTNFS